MVDDDPLLGPEQVVRDQQGSERILCHNAASVADDVRVPGLEAEHLLHGEPRVHARDDGELAGRWHGEVTQGKGAGVARVSAQYVVDDTHRSSK